MPYRRRPVVHSQLATDSADIAAGSPERNGESVWEPESEREEEGEGKAEDTHT